MSNYLKDAKYLIGVWNERQARRMPLLFAPTIGAALAARYSFLWVRYPACRTTRAVDLRVLDRHPSTAVTGPTPALSCRSCQPTVPASLPPTPTVCTRVGNRRGVHPCGIAVYFRSIRMKRVYKCMLQQ